MIDYYYLDENRNAIPTDDVELWSDMFGDSISRRVSSTKVANGESVITVFLGLDHSYVEGPPMIFESRVFKDDGNFEDVYMWQYSTWDEAEAGHNQIVEWMNNHAT